MTDESARRLRQALEKILPRRNRAFAARPPMVDVTSVRVRMGMTQEQFAALVLLNVIECEPRAVLRALSRR